MENVNMSLSKDKKTLTLTIDLSKKGELSKTGKSFVVASTRGNQAIPEHEGMFLGLNCYEYAVKR
jgi:hypothetical protein